MNIEMLAVILSALSLLTTTILLVMVLLRLKRQDNAAPLAQNNAELLAQIKQEIERFSTQIAGQQRNDAQLLGQNLTLQAQQQAERLTHFAKQVELQTVHQNQRLDGFAEQSEKQARAQAERLELFARQLDAANKTLADRVDGMRRETGQHLEQLQKSNTEQLDKMQKTSTDQLEKMQKSNAEQLDKMRVTVGEKLDETLNTRLTTSFTVIDESLQKLQLSLGEMKNINQGVTDLNRTLSDVKKRGNWGEMQLGLLLEQMMAPNQYATNVKVLPNSDERVEFAVILPGQEGTIFLPIDAKFPQEDYQRLVDATDKAAEEQAGKALEVRIAQEAKKIHEKYIQPPFTTDFGIMYLPTEGLYAEVVRRPGLANLLQDKYRVMVAGPTTLAALLNSLQMGFRTLQIEKRSSEVWRLLGAVRSQFGKFSGLLEATGKKLEQAQKGIDDATKRTRLMDKKLRSVEELPEVEAMLMLGESVESAAPASDDDDVVGG